MIPFERNRQQAIPASSLKVIGLGVAGANMLDRAALDGMDGAELLALNTDQRTLAQSVASEKLQLGPNLTKGLGAGGDPELGKQAVMEIETEIREAVKGRSIVFLCVGLGGGTGSGAAPFVTRVAREEGAFVVVFATMPFSFEGSRRREQAETALNELAVLSNALVTFDNGRMGELVLAKQGIHEAFEAADRMISESIKAVTRLVVKPGLVNVGLDDLMTALKTNRSRCLFGSGIAKGKNRAQTALKNALASPLLDKGSLLNDAESVMVHVSGGAGMTLHEVEHLMQGLTKHVPEKAHILFGAAIDEAMGESLSVTVISALPESKLTATRPTITVTDEDPFTDEEFDDEREGDEGGSFVPAVSLSDLAPKPNVREVLEDEERLMHNDGVDFDEGLEEMSSKKTRVNAEEVAAAEAAARAETEAKAEATRKQREERKAREEAVAKAQAEAAAKAEAVAKAEAKAKAEAAEAKAKQEREELEEKQRAEEEARRRAEEEEQHLLEEEQKEEQIFRVVEEDQVQEEEQEPLDEFVADSEEDDDDLSLDGEDDFDDYEDEVVKLKNEKDARSQAELDLEGGPRGRFEGEKPNLVDGEDLDVPPYLRRKAK